MSRGSRGLGLVRALRPPWWAPLWRREKAGDRAGWAVSPPASPRDSGPCFSPLTKFINVFVKRKSNLSLLKMK